MPASSRAVTSVAALIWPTLAGPLETRLTAPWLDIASPPATAPEISAISPTAPIVANCSEPLVEAKPAAEVAAPKLVAPVEARAVAPPD